MGRPTSQLAVSAGGVRGGVGTVCVLDVEGILDGTTYRKLRDAIIKAALDEPQAVIVDINTLGVPASSAWSVFTSAR